jgi:hypothetical protein
MKKLTSRQRTLVLRKDTIQVLAAKDLEVVAGGIESNTLTLCLTVKTCVSFEFAC